jgi:hypothetical protein
LSERGAEVGVKLVLAIAVVAVALPPVAAAKEDPRCSGPQTGFFDVKGVRQLKPETDGDKLLLTFDADKGSRHDTVVMDAPGVDAKSPVVSRVRGELRKTTGDRRALDMDIKVRAAPQDDGTMDVHACATRTEDGSAGRYAGSVSVGGINLATTQVRLEVTQRDSALAALGWAALAAVVLVVLAVFVGTWPKSGSGDNAPTRRPLQIVACVFAVAAGVIGAYLVGYKPNPTWGGGDKDEIKVLLLSATIATTTLTFFGVAGIPVLQKGFDKISGG